MLSEDLSYIAALLDGEGCISLQLNHPNDKVRTATYLLKVRITNTYKPVLDWLLSVSGGKLYKVKKYMPQRKQAWSWEMSGSEAVQFLHSIYPYLRIKKSQAETAFMFGETLSVSGQKKRLSDGIIFIRECLAKRMTEFNCGIEFL